MKIDRSIEPETGGLVAVPGEVYARWRRLIPRSNDPVLVVLKAHLLAEERLDWILEQFCRAKQPLKEARLSFFQKLQLSRALLGGWETQWQFLAELNRLRNALAHNAELPDVASKIARVVGILGPLEELRTQPLTALRNGSMLTCAMLEGAAMEASRRLCRAER